MMLKGKNWGMTKGKEVLKEQEQIEKLITVEEGQEFLKLIEKNEFKIVD